MPKAKPTQKTKSSDDLAPLRHSLAHLLAKAVLGLYPGARNAIGPSIENGFYQDFDLGDARVTDADLPRIEKKMREILPTWQSFSYNEVSLAEAEKLFAWNKYKVELAREFAQDGKKLQTNNPGNFLDLCKMDHVKNPSKELTHFKLLSVAGAYWRGDENNKMLTRIYGTAFFTEDELTAYLNQLEEAAKRDHRKLGQALDLFSFDPVSPGAVFWHPNGQTVWVELEKLLREYLTPAGYTEIQTPLMVKPELLNRSGHLKHYKENMFRVLGNDEEFYLKPMNCPESAVVFASKSHSYRDLPVRLSEIGRIHRNELSGTLGGLFRVRQITQDDGHLYCRPDQLEAEITQILELSKKIYSVFGLKPGFFLSTKPDNAMGDPALWQKAEAALNNALKANHLPFEIKPKEGTFYAPKIDIDITDSLGRRWQLCTIQADLVMVPSLPGVEYTDEHGKKRRPVVIHRAIFGSFERFIGILIEHFAGNLPLWLAPTQIELITVGSRHEAYAYKLKAELMAAGLRASVDDANETVGNKIRQAIQMKVPYLLVLGDKEVKASRLAIRIRSSKEIVPMAKTALIKKLQKLVASRSLEL